MSETDPTTARPRSVGALLSAAREAQEIPVERAAKETRIRVQRLRDIEKDDFSHFSNPSYARMFLIAYAKYLGVSVNRVHEFLPVPGESGSDGFGYIHSGHDDLPSLRPNLTDRRPRSALPKVVLLIIVLVLAALGVLTVYLVTNLPRLTSVERMLNEPAPPPEPIVLEPIVLDNLQPDGSQASDAESGILDVEIDLSVVPDDAENAGSVTLDETAPSDQSAPSAPPISAADEEFLRGIEPTWPTAQPVESPSVESEESDASPEADGGTTGD